jgi:hypothetical protein
VYCAHSLLFRFLDNWAHPLATAFYFGVLGFTAGAPVRQSRSLPARIITMGFAVFLLIVGATYTGGTAAALVSKSSQGQITSLHAIIEADTKVCIADVAMKDNFLMKFPEFTNNILWKDENGPWTDAGGGMGSLAAMDRNECDGVIISETVVKGIFNHDTTHCNKVFIDSTLLEIPNAWPISDGFAKEIGYIISERVAVRAHRLAVFRSVHLCVPQNTKTVLSAQSHDVDVCRPGMVSILQPNTLIHSTVLRCATSRIKRLNQVSHSTPCKIVICMGVLQGGVKMGAVRGFQFDG